MVDAVIFVPKHKIQQFLSLCRSLDIHHTSEGLSCNNFYYGIITTRYILYTIEDAEVGTWYPRKWFEQRIKNRKHLKVTGRS